MLLQLFSSYFPTRSWAGLRNALCLLAFAWLVACSSHTGTISSQVPDQRREAEEYAARARRNYEPPGPPEDPWRPYIAEASQRFDVPERWIREVMRVESGGKQYVNGQLITSPKGAMGLMQVMPMTYDLMRAHYGLGDDPYDPRNNILAGTAYIREMYNLYGSPAFLAAYNAGPARLDDYLQHNRPLPSETRRYVAMIAPYISDSWPRDRSSAQQVAWNYFPDQSFGRSSSRRPILSGSNAGAGYARHTSPPVSGSLLAAAVQPDLPEPPTPPRFPIQMAVASAPHGGGGNFRLISQAVAAEAPLPRSSHGNRAWAIQIGAFGTEAKAHAALLAVRGQVRRVLTEARPAIAPLYLPHGKLYRVRWLGLSRDSAVEACDRLSRQHISCMLVSPAAQS
jgi:cell division protein FtsN